MAEHGGQTANPVADMQAFEDENGSETDLARKGKKSLMGGLGKGLDAVKSGVDGVKNVAQHGVEGAVSKTSVKDLMKFADLAGALPILHCPLPVALPAEYALIWMSLCSFWINSRGGRK